MLKVDAGGHPGLVCIAGCLRECVSFGWWHICSDATAATASLRPFKPRRSRRCVCSYMAPEVMRGDPYNAAVDIFALGCVIWSVFAGQSIASRFQDDKDVREYARRVGEGWRLPMPARFPEGLCRIIKDTWSAEAAERPTAAQVLTQLRAFGLSSDFDEFNGVQASTWCLFSRR